MNLQGLRNCDKDATGAGRIVHWRDHFLTHLLAECSISSAVLAGPVRRCVLASTSAGRTQAFGTYQFLINERGRMMKKLLLGSTALVAGGLLAAPAMAADPIKIGVGGYYQFFVNAGQIEGSYALDGSSTQFKGLSFYQEGEIHFDGQSKLDNGTTVGVHVELEGWNSAPSNTTGTGSVRQIDEAYLYAFGDWGRIEFGSRDQGTYRMFYGAPSAIGVYLGFFQHNSNATWINPTVAGTNLAAGGISFMTIGGQMQDVNRINYFTPRFMGLQIGVGYAPKINQSGATGPGLAASTCGFTDATAQVVCPTNDYSWQDFFDVGANYLNKFGDVTVALFGAFMYASFVPGYANNGTLGGNLITGSNLTAWKQWVIGAQFGFAGFTVGGSYSYDNNGLGSNWYTGVDNDNRKYAAGIMYETGPWQLSVGWAGVRNNNGNGVGSIRTIAIGTNAATVGGAASTSAAFGTNPNAGALSFGYESADKFEVGANYALGPGIKMMGGVVFYNVAGPSNASAQQSWMALLGMDLRF
jgi:outer membrane protein OmpU